MKTITATQARAGLYRLLADVQETHQPVTITGRQGNGVLISEEDFRAIEETLYLVSMPGMRQSIRDGLETPVADCSDAELDW